MRAADVVDVTSDHARAVAGNDPAQIGHRQAWPVFGQQPSCAEPTAAVAAAARNGCHSKPE